LNCCDYNCEQGRNCPARVARVGARYPAFEPLPPSPAPALLKRAARVMLLGVIGLLLYGALLAAFVIK
jgi:hypothetical protein